MCRRLALDELPWATLSSLWLEDQELDGVGAGALRGEVMEVLAELLEPWAPRRNMVPIQDMLIIRSGYAMGALGDPQDNHQIDLARWGLIPGWANRRRTGERLLCAPAHAARASPRSRSKNARARTARHAAASCCASRRKFFLSFSGFG